MNRARYGGIKPGRIPLYVGMLGVGIAGIVCAAGDVQVAGMILIITAAGIVAGAAARWL